MSPTSAIVVSETAIVGAACQLPGAPDLAAFWALMQSERNSVSPRPVGRWNVERFLRPGKPSPGFTYTFAGGYIERPLAFDPAPFGLSPREVEQMDPQQRLLLRTVWRAFEDAGIAPSSVAGRSVGVYVGASVVDYQSAASHDPALMGSHFMTGNSLSILSNRISYVFDLKGPSFTVDSACSSSFIALTQAVTALEAGKIDMAIVAGVNLLLSPAPFIGFSQARMLSPTGACRPFSNDGDGYVRAEGAAAVLLQRHSDAASQKRRIRGVIAAAGTNSDGWTNGIALPSFQAQQTLIEDMYAAAGVSAEDLAFVEAHGTGTKIGDPVEAMAIGRALGKHRSRPLPIGSVKSNIGHLEAASGLAGLLKSVLAFEHGVVPRSLFSDVPSKAIDFAGLNLELISAARPFEETVAGICNYGFGGSNAHVILRKASDPVAEARPRPRLVSAKPGSEPRAPEILLVSAASEDALKVRARQLADGLGSSLHVCELASALGHQAEWLPHRVACPVPDDDFVASRILRDFADGVSVAGEIVHIRARQDDRLAIFVFSGNGSQYAAMGKAAYVASAAFRYEIAEIDKLCAEMVGWSLADRLRDGVSSEDLAQTSVAQPLIFAVQSALAAVLKGYGLHPAAVVGHSIGEIAAAEAAGILSREEALRVIHARSAHQQLARGTGKMLVLAAQEQAVRAFIEERGYRTIDIAAINGPGSTTVAGSNEEIDALAVAARKNRMASVSLDVEYPFHSALLAPLHDNLVADLGSLTGRVGGIDFFSTVTGQRAAGSSINALYWADNMRQTVRFMPAIEAALESYPDAVFVEIGARPILGSVVNDILRKQQKTNPVLATLSAQKTASGDPIRFVAASLVAHGVRHDHAAVFGDRTASTTPLPPYPFQDEDFYLGETSEAIGVYGRPMTSSSLHPLLGARMAEGSPEWRCPLDTTLLPYLKDHVVNGAVIAPATAFVEMALAAADALHPGARLELDEFDILRPLTFGEDETREISIRYANRTEAIEIWSRKRLSGEDWLLHARGVIRALPSSEAPQAELPRPISPRNSTAKEVYAAAERAGLSYGRAFQLVASGAWDETVGHSVLMPAIGGTGAFASDHVLHPISFDAAFHGLLLARRQRDGERKAYLPIRFRKIRVWRPRQPVLRAVTELVRETDRFKSVRVFLLGEGDAVVASVDAAVFRAVHLIKPFVAERTFCETQVPVAPAPVRLSEAPAEGPALSDWRHAAHVRLLLKATAIGLAQRLFLESAAVVDTVPQWLMQATEELLETAGALEGEAEGRVLSAGFSVPAPEAILATICARFPQANAEIQLVSQALAGVDALLAPVAPAQASATRPGQSWWASSLQARQAAEAIAVQVAQIVADRQGLRILVTGEAGPILAGAITDVLAPGIADLVVLRDATSLPDPASQAGERANRFDLLVGLHGSEPLSDGATGLAALVGQLGPDAAILIGAADADGNTAFLQTAGMPAAELALPPAVREWLMAANVVDLSGEVLIDAAITLYRGRAPKRPTLANTKSRVLLLSIPEAPVSSAELGLEAADVLEASPSEELDAWLAARSDEDSAILLPLAIKDCDSALLAARLDLLIALLCKLGEARRTLLFMVVTMPDATGESADASLAVRAAIAGFVRVAINEFPDLDLRLADVETADLASRLVDIVRDPGREREWRIRREGICVNRMRRGMVDDVALDRDERAVLHFGESGSLSGFEWRKEPREAPAEGDVEVEVAASSLNYRDLLVALGVLDDDLLGAGLTRAALGFECSGTVVRVGPGVTTLSPGDRVMGFAAGTFASHLVCPASHMFPVPQGMTLEAAATIPVAFATAWYALVEQGRIKAGEKVLIHGGAGGVGLAAIQIAKLKQAEILATARSGARQALALAAGAGHAFDSRNEHFERDIRDRFGGVDLVLNSLAGAAMLASFRLLKPFGRFLELGKRDFLDNSMLPLRPFVRNIAYSGIDLDELLAHDLPSVRRMVEDVAALFEVGQLRPLPYRSFPASDVDSAFRLMQASDHVGKIVVSPPKTARIDVAKAEFQAKPGLYLVVGGTTGLGFATAKWLAGRGATAIALLSRRGQVDADLVGAVSELQEAGVNVAALPLDVRDGEAVKAAVERLVADHGPIRGMVHAAVHLDDGLIANLTPERLREVLRAKTDGIVNLEVALEGQPLDFFAAYSSASALIGSPGQAAYVTANTFLEGFMTRRRRLGKPALAIGWGAISDVGILARDKQLGQRLRRMTGMSAISSSEALAHLGRLLSLGDAVGPVQYLTNMGRSAAADKLALLKSPAFTSLGLMAAGQDQDAADEAMLDLVNKGPREALAIVKNAMLREVASILRLPVDRIDPDRPLGEIGLDSLMALELHLALETSLGTQIALVGVGDRTLSGMAQMIVNQVCRVEGPADDEPTLADDSAPSATIAMGARQAGDQAAMPEQALRATHSGTFGQ